MENKIEEKTYAEIWRDTVPDEDTISDKFRYGSKNFTKMVQFAYDVKLNNDIIDELMSLNPMEEDENDRGLVSKFQKQLLKFRYVLYAYPNLSTKQLKRKKRNEQRKNS